MPRTIGPVFFDLLGTELSSEETEILQHPLVGGVILFSRNYESPAQLKHLCETIKTSRQTPVIIGVDHEGGRVQRFRTGFTAIPPMGDLGKLYEVDTQKALQMAEHLAYQMANELKMVGVDLSFAPVLDLNRELNTVIGDRAFHSQPAIVTTLAKAFVKGMHKAGMAATGKHFPGHGGVTLDSHAALPIDEREFQQILKEDLIPFKELIQTNINAVMPAHIIFSAVDDKPVGFSEHWLQKILREQLKFSGIVFSDDLNMEGASFAGDYASRAQTALQAGCDMVLICNNRKGAVNILDNLSTDFAMPIEKIKLLSPQK